MKNTAVWSGKTREILLEERQELVPPPGWLRIRVAGVGICGSDLHTYSSGGPLGGVPGHEVAGVVDLVGEGVSLEVGSGVAIEPIASCGVCINCLEGYRWHCSRSIFLGGEGDGGMATHMLAPEAASFSLPENVPPEEGSFVEPLAVGLHALNQASVNQGDSLLILGAGTVGLCTALVARQLGIQEVYITAKHSFQADIAKLYGAVPLNPDEVLTQLRSTSIDTVIETVGGRADTLLTGLRAVRSRGNIVVVGVFTESIDFPVNELLLKEVRLFGAVCYARKGDHAEFKTAALMLAQVREEMQIIKTHSFELSEIAKAFEVAADKSLGAVKVQICP